MYTPTCIKCNGHKFERITNETWIHSAEYVDEKLEIKLVDSSVHASYVQCANTECRLINIDSKIEELFY